MHCMNTEHLIIIADKNEEEYYLLLCGYLSNIYKTWVYN